MMSLMGFSSFNPCPFFVSLDPVPSLFLLILSLSVLFILSPPCLESVGSDLLINHQRRRGSTQDLRAFKGGAPKDWLP